MDARLIFVKTPLGDEAVRQSTRVVQRNLRMVLVQVDGNLSVGELSAKIGNQALVERALQELLEGKFIATLEGQVLEPGPEPEQVPAKAAGRTENVAPSASQSVPFPASQFSTFEQLRPVQPAGMQSANSQFSSFGKPILPTAGYREPGERKAEKPRKPERKPEIEAETDMPAQPRRLGRWLLGVPVGGLIFLLLLVLLFPYNRYKPELEGAMGEMLEAPVKIGSVGISVWPRLALSLSDVRVGEGEEGAIESMRIASPLSLLGSGPHRIDVVDVTGARVVADFLAGSSLFRARAPEEKRPLVRRINLERLTVTARDLAVRDLVGQIAFKADGSVEKATLANDDAGLRIEAMPSGEGIALDIHGAGWKPLGDALVFNSMQARGLLHKGKLVIQDLDTLFLGGVLKGSWLLDWSKGGLSMAGDAALQRIDCRKVAKAFVPALNMDGELAGTLRLRGSGTDWNSLWHGVEAQLDADVTRGTLHGVDLGDAARGGRGGVVRGGATRFDRLRGHLAITEGQVNARDLQMSAGMVSATGQFSAASGRPLDAALMVTMQTSVTAVRTPVRIAGELSNLQVLTGK